MSGIHPTKLITGQPYRFTATAAEGSGPGLMQNGRRLFTDAKFLGGAGGDYEFEFNGMKLFVDGGEQGVVFTWDGVGPNPHAVGGRRNKKSRKNRNRKNRKNKTNRKSA
jgi:hypothetical protein